MTEADHKRLVLPGPVEVRREILDAQAGWMIGHRTPEFAELYARIQSGLKQAFFTENPVYVSTSSGSGLWEAASRNCVRADRRVLHLVGGAFASRWADVSRANGKQVDTVEVEWGRAITPDLVEEALSEGEYDAVCLVHNETSTGVVNPVAEIGALVNQAPDTLFLLDTVSGFLGAKLRVDEWGIDVALTSSQKAFALPPGLSFAAVSERALKRAEQVAHRGYYFDFLVFDKYYRRNNTPATPPVSLLFAADRQLKDILAEGLENRWARHRQMQGMAIEWALGHDFGLYAQEGYRSPTVTTVVNTPGVDVLAMAAFMVGRKWAMDTGYGKLKGQVFRIPHMGDIQPATLQAFLSDLDDYLAGQSE
jgi:predicted phosphoserine aminotransferase